MSGLPVLSGRECRKALEQAGFQFRRQVGSHTVLRRPDHNELDRGTLRAVIRQAGLTVDQFLRLVQ
ncbi:MAG: type II toxin-antitoxin system HicA family toxin [candidate division WOR-3 bacterium]|nr:MAG: type II toxin-antitoxin system HicA family toxin [candidate division WOR-3 bacterium]